VRFPASNNTHRNNVGSATSRQQSKFNNKSFIEFVSEDEIQKSLSENCVGCFVHKYFGTLRQDVVRYLNIVAMLIFVVAAINHPVQSISKNRFNVRQYHSSRLGRIFGGGP
jgi:hypothetical protein